MEDWKRARCWGSTYLSSGRCDDLCCPDVELAATRSGLQIGMTGCFWQHTYLERPVINISLLASETLLSETNCF